MAMNAVSHYLEFVLPQRPGFAKNTVQCAYAESISQCLAAGAGTLHFVEGDTGIGKTLAYLLSLADWVARGKACGRQAVISTHSRALQRQLIDERNIEILNDYLVHEGLPLLSVGIRLGRGNYASPERVASALGYQSLESVLQSDQSTHAERALAQWAIDGGALNDLDMALLPEDTALSDIALHSTDPLPQAVGQFFQETQQCDIQILNHALLALDIALNSAVTGANEPVALLLDEAEHFPSVAESMLSARLSFQRVALILKRNHQKKAAAKWDEAFNLWRSLQRAGHAETLKPQHRILLVPLLLALCNSRQGAKASHEDRHYLSELKVIGSNMLAQLKGSSDQLVISYSSERGFPSLIKLDNTAGALLKARATERSTILTSATLSDCDQNSPHDPPGFEYMRRRLLLSANDGRIGVKAVHQTHSFGTLCFRLPAIDLPPLVSVGHREFRLNDDFASAIWADITEMGSNGRILLLCGSYNDVEVLKDTAQACMSKRIVTHEPGALLSKLTASMPANGIFITPAGWEGLSPERTEGNAFWAHVGIVRNPTSRPDPIQELVRERYLAKTMDTARAKRAATASLRQEAQVQTLHKLRQGIGRAIRHPDDNCTVTFYDPRFPSGRSMSNVNTLNWLSYAIPFRFRMKLMEAQAENSNLNIDNDTKLSELDFRALL